MKKPHPSQKLPLILASTSPRRKELLQQLKIPFHTLAPQIDETPHPKESPRALVQRLVREKGKAVQSKAFEKWGPCLILAADTIVISAEKKILNKPQSQAEAKAMLLSLSGTKHTVLTGYSLSQLGASQKNTSKSSWTCTQQLVRCISTTLQMRSLTPALLKAYLKTGESMDKAGAYGIQNYGALLIQKISGNYTTVLGLPLFEIFQDLERAFQIPLSTWFVSKNNQELNHG